MVCGFLLKKKWKKLVRKNGKKLFEKPLTGKIGNLHFVLHFEGIFLRNKYSNRYAYYDGLDDEAVEDDPNIVNDFDYGIDLFPQLDDNQPDDPLEVAEVTEVVEVPIEPMEVEAEPQIDLKKCVGN